MLTCPGCAIAVIVLVLQVPTLRPRQYAQVSKRVKTVQRAYGGSRCANCVRERIVRAFLVEEAKIVKRVRSDSLLSSSVAPSAKFCHLFRTQDSEPGTWFPTTGHCPAAAGQEVDEFVGNLDLFFFFGQKNKPLPSVSLQAGEASERTGYVESWSLFLAR